MVKEVRASGREGARSSAFGQQTAEVNYRYYQVKAEDVIVVIFTISLWMTVPGSVLYYNE
jgi:hypothetical protein